MVYTAASSLIGYQPIRPGWRATLTTHGALPDADTILATYDQWCRTLNIDPNLAVAQACHEATYFTSERWTAENNPAGLGIVADNTPPNPFTSPQEGIEAHIEHLCAYAYTDATCPVDHPHMADRRHVFHEGYADLAGLERTAHWAVPGDGYVQSIVAIANSIAGAPPITGGAMNLIDIRDQLPTSTAPGHGPNTTGITPRRGIVIHYSAVNYPADRAMLDILKSEAQYHVDEDWGGGNRGDGLMYHISVDPQTGEQYQCRDLGATLWHCAFWGDPGNSSGYAIHVPGGDALVMSDVALASLAGLCDTLGAQDGFGRAMVKGHQEVSPTACPGPLMEQFVLPYRAGTLAGGPPLPPNVSPTYLLFPATGHGIDGGFRAWWEARGGVGGPGYPLTEEFQYQARTTQIFQRDAVQWFPEHKGTPYEFQGLLLGTTFAKSLGFTGPGIN